MTAISSCEPNHQYCIDAALKRAAQLCLSRKQRLTSLRRRVLELIWQAHKPVSAYALLEQLRLDGRSAAPPTVYRALDFLVEQGLVHRLASLNAFIGCSEPGHSCQGLFLICRCCKEIAELQDQSLQQVILNSANHQGFEVATAVLELAGICRSCQDRRSCVELTEPRITGG